MKLFAQFKQWSHVALWLPVFLLSLLACVAVMRAPDGIVKDASEYDEIAQSIVQGKYELQGQPTMLREPGYPAFRALVYSAGGSARSVLWAQVVLLVGGLVVFTRAMQQLLPAFAARANWALLIFGFSYPYYASRHLAETLAGFLLTLLFWLVVQAQRPRDWRIRGGVAVAGAMLALTRFPLVCIPFACLLALGWQDWCDGSDGRQKTRALLRGGASMLLLAMCILPWSIRNGVTFGRWSIADRAGIQVYARAYKAEASWSSLIDTYGSVMVGRAWQRVVAPQAHPIITEQWKAVWDLYRGPLAERFPVLSERDAFLQKTGTAMIFSSPTTMARYAMWTGVETLRLFALASPRSQDFSIESMFAAGESIPGKGALITIGTLHLLQLGWWIGITLGLWVGFKRFGERFIPGVIVIAGMAPHVALDAIIRYAVPLLPFVAALVAVGTPTTWIASVRRFLFARRAPVIFEEAHEPSR